MLISAFNRTSSCIADVKNVTISSCRFSSNRGTCIHVINQNVYFTGKILFTNNEAKDDTGKIYISGYSIVIFNKSSDVTFNQNSATYGLFLNDNSAILFDQNSTVMFNNNAAFHDGIIYSKFNSSVIFAASCKVTFNNNSGSAIRIYF